jgi:outer membrane protein insertion porin family
VENSALEVVDYMRENWQPIDQINTIEKFNVAYKKIYINYVISNGPSLYIERIDITGNQRTFDYVVREQLVFQKVMHTISPIWINL